MELDFANISDMPITLTKLDETKITFSPFIATEVEVNDEREREYLKNQMIDKEFVRVQWSGQFLNEQIEKIKRLDDKQLMSYYYHWRNE
jgi:hypothetical protein